MPTKHVAYPVPDRPLRPSANTRSWLALKFADTGYSDVRERLGLPRLGDITHTNALRLWEAWEALGSWESVAKEWRGEGCDGR